MVVPTKKSCTCCRKLASPEKAKAWLDEKLANKQKIMGFGHRIYRLGDSRVPTMTKFRDQMAELKGGQKWVEISNILEEQMVSQKKIYPESRFPRGAGLFSDGVRNRFVHAIFVMARTAGWVAHVGRAISRQSLGSALGRIRGAGAVAALTPIAERG